ncbi:hypothetical protein [Bradyrhizobium sp. 144]|uniref:hypothetical protein n=1 Tax=Bradyrhizobium sp. 144 TaxID=2782620 RepID=UPI001FFACBBF|nr:hypothetical protein [Bradyrhizobium sp. 144]MCK1695147.1 hypothetical protein [Bradyrhizobium sp. 144]
MTVSFGRFSLKNPISTGRNRMECVPSASAGKSFSPKRQRILEKLSGAPCQFRQERDRRHFVYASGTPPDESATSHCGRVTAARLNCGRCEIRPDFGMINLNNAIGQGTDAVVAVARSIKQKMEMFGPRLGNVPAACQRPKQQFLRRLARRQITN